MYLYALFQYDFMRRYSFLMLLIPMMVACSSKTTTTLTFIETTDTHGAYAEFSNDASVIRQMKADLGPNLILLDNGDNLQGTPYQYLSNRDAEHPNLASSVLNFFPYDVICVGNHDVEAGRQVFDRLYSEVTMPVVCANVIDESTGKPYWQPYVVLKRDGFKIAVLGLLTPYVVTWVPERLRPGLRFEKAEDAAEHWVKVIQEKEHPDLMVGLFHSGWEPQEQNLPEDAPLGRENSTKWIAENVQGFDLIFYGHDHRAKADKVLNIEGDTVYVLNSGTRGASLAEAEVIFSKNARPKIKVGLIPTTDQEADPDFEELLQPYLERAQEFQDQDVAVLPLHISPNDVYQGSCLWVDEIHRCQFDVAEANGIHADISFAAPLNRRFELEPGMLKVADFFKWYPFENSLAVMRMTGRDVKAHLEYSYEIRNTIYNFDCAAGINYVIEKEKPYGERVVILSMAEGSAFDFDKTYQVVMNSYRSMGGGNHFVNGCGWHQEEVREHQIWNSEEDLRTLFIAWARQKGTLDDTPLQNWKVK